VPYHVGLVIGNTDFRRKLVRAIQGLSGHRIVFATASNDHALAQFDQDPVDLVIVELGHAELNGVDFLRRLSTSSPGTEAMVLTTQEDEALLFEALRAGAVGYLWKDTPPEAVVAAMADLRKGGVPMSPGVARRIVQTFTDRAAVPSFAPTSTLTGRETEILAMLAQGLTYQSVAKRLQLSGHTVHSHVRNIYGKLQVNSRSEAVYEAIRRKLLQMT
jgi:DNA-binding NarL/FixJ family response regulator